jgi:hypothetical protein
MEWVHLVISIKINVFFKKFKRPNEFFRRLSKGGSSFSRITNKSFFSKSISGGFYRLNSLDDRITFHFYFETKSNVQLRNVEMNLRFRIKRNFPCEIYFEHLKKQDVHPLYYPNLYQSIGEYYFGNTSTLI